MYQARREKGGSWVKRGTRAATEGMGDDIASRKKPLYQGAASTTRRLWGNAVCPTYGTSIRTPLDHHSLTRHHAQAAVLLAAHRHILSRIPSSHSLARRGPRPLQGTHAGPLHPGQPSCRIIASPSRLTPIAPRNLIFQHLPIALSQSPRAPLRWACCCCHLHSDLFFRAALASSDHYNRPNWGHESAEARR